MDLEFKTKNEKQILAAERWIDDVTEEIVYGGAKGGGKSFLGAALVFADALMYPGTHYYIARRELIDLRNFTIPTIHEVFKKWGIDIKKYATYNGQDHKYIMRNGSVVHLIACKDEPSDPLFERFGSMQMTRGWLEEAGEIPEAAKANLWLATGRWKNDEYKLKKKQLITANPKKGWMKRDFVDPYKLGTLPRSRAYIQAFATDNTYLPKDYLETLKNEKDKVRRQRLWEGNWDYDDDQDSLTSYDAIADAFTNTIVKDGQKYMTVDVARQGRDTTVLAIWDGLELYDIGQYKKLATTSIEQKVRDCARIERIPFSHIIVDEDGVGGGVVDHLVGVKGFTGNSQVILSGAQIRERLSRAGDNIVKPEFANLRAQCGWKMAELLNEHQVAFRTPEYRDAILEELTALLRNREPDGEGKKRLREKADIKQEIGRSPDIGDAILMRAYFELVRESSPMDEPARARAMSEQTIRLRQNRGNRNARSNK